MNPVGSVKAVILNADKKMLVLRRSHTHPSDAGQPDLPGGIIERYEEPKMAIIREIEEETGLIIDQSKVELVYENELNLENPFKRYVYLIRFSENPLIKLSWEHDSYEWMEVEHLAKIEEKYIPFYAEALRYLTSHKII